MKNLIKYLNQYSESMEANALLEKPTETNAEYSNRMRQATRKNNEIQKTRKILTSEELEVLEAVKNAMQALQTHLTK
tara:strand:- start:41 stop:271 length:231 start_codon:yes stop_codon:yes gene_type:complete